MTQMLPRVDERQCTGNGDCVAVCPTACLEMRRNAPLLMRPRDCISCALCAAVCPTEAIRMEERWLA